MEKEGMERESKLGYIEFKKRYLSTRPGTVNVDEITSAWKRYLAEPSVSSSVPQGRVTCLKPTPAGWYLEEIMKPGSGFDVYPGASEESPVTLTDKDGNLVHAWRDNKGKLQVRRI